MQSGQVVLLLIMKVLMMSVPVDANTRSYVYGGCGPYDYDESGFGRLFSNVVHAADQPLWDDCNKSQLGVVAELVDIKVDGHISERIYDRISKRANRILPSDQTLPRDYYSTKKLVKGLGLLVQKIHACKNGCMLYLKDNVDLEYCKFCGDGCILRGRPEHMTWHATYQTVKGSMCHPSDAEAWKYFDRMCHDFAEEPRNIWLGLCTDGFAPHEIPGLSNPKHLINVYLKPLIEEPLQLWHVDVKTHDHATDDFVMRTTLMWTVNDLPAYGMAFRWSTAGVRRDLKIICDRFELELDERKPNVMPKEVYTLGKEQKRRLCEWIRGLKFPDGYASILHAALT
ncbi:hypothetical protein Sango_2924600 [Sesamum angolense]|uniref:Uncharacterized protein n=1 Tax=Sesamum angolense TaxID=2727404 RepID=A0AAE1VZU4_9LAMI|nr:hypothetical protein Sango_2924600 [Sesamum angolense]